MADCQRVYIGMWTGSWDASVRVAAVVAISWAHRTRPSRQARRLRELPDRPWEFIAGLSRVAVLWDPREAQGPVAAEILAQTFTIPETIGTPEGQTGSH